LEAFLDSFPGTLIKTTGVTEVVKVRAQAVYCPNGQNAHAMLPELAQNVAPTEVPLHEFEFKIGAPVMIIRNVLYPHLVNGRVMTIARFTPRCMFIRSSNSNQQYVVNRIDFLFNFNGAQMRRRKFPIRLAFASTVQKRQGRTHSRVVVDLRAAFFTPGQLYVTLSRTRHGQHVLLLYATEEENVNADQPAVHEMPLPTTNPILPEAMEFATPP
jgi:hypothetical protein